ncbi:MULTISPECIES: hypothetical protein [Chryseobacterium]|uniref:Uncharacterized protein n=1 Tax=Chryseobacterium limigenitum TaxID=1612149 RepID=A0A1K2ISB7_9FLAO|nr:MULTISPECIES: hypothetical protein [Chryseobacterium]MDQ0593397.1 hypothetical protein [Chryseobacterium ginsenosidimutans]SFZ95348.1 hypothetical protein SAMN05216324_10991 [Chryseobacterium limigenitum]VXC00321.1 conserved hypothetical protein [Chryseobacterium sp. 8AT]
MKTIDWSRFNSDIFTHFCNALLSFEFGNKFIPFSAPGNYLITLFKPPLTNNSPHLELKVFSQLIVEKLNLFVKKIITTLIGEVSANTNLPF